MLKLFVSTVKKALDRIRANYKSTLRVDLDLPRKKGRVFFATENTTAKRWFYPRYLTGALHEPQLTKLLVAELNDSDVFFDVGANLGWFTLLSSQICTRGEVHSFEMDPKLSSLMLDSLALNFLSGSHFINNLAVTDGARSMVKFSAMQAGNRSTNQVYRDRDGTGIRAGSISLDEYCSAMRCSPTFIKMDIEGGELAAIKGMQTLLAMKRPQLALEVHPAHIREQGGSPQELVNSIRDLVPTYDVSLLVDYRNIKSKPIVPFPERYRWSDRPVVLYFREQG